MYLSVISDYSFKSSIYNYILENLSIIPKVFNNHIYVGHNNTTNELTSLSYNLTSWELKIYTCRNDVKHLHSHNEDDNILVFCTEPEIIAVTYIYSSVRLSKDRFKLLSTLKHWLPIITLSDVRIDYNVSNIVSDLEPTYTLNFLNANTEFDTLEYTFIQNKITNKFIDLIYNPNYNICREYRIIKIKNGSW